MPNLSDRDTAIILAALRYYQEYETMIGRAMDDHYVAEGIEPPTDADIDELCERINLAVCSPLGSITITTGQETAHTQTRATAR